MSRSIPRYCTVTRRSSKRDSAASVRPCWPGILWSLLLCLAHVATTFAHEDAATLLARADELKTSHPAEFADLLDVLRARHAELAPAERHYLEFLLGWRAGYTGHYDTALAGLRAVIAQTDDFDLRFRARAAVVNLLSLSRRYDPLFEELEQLLADLPHVTTPAARRQGLAVLGVVYNQMAQYELGLRYADQLLAENPDGRFGCIARQLRIEALYETDRLTAGSQVLADGMAACHAAGERLYAGLIAADAARLLRAAGRLEEAIALLERSYAAARGTGYARLLAELDALLAEAHWENGNVQAAHKFAGRALRDGVQNHFTEPTITAYRLLYRIARERGDVAAALEYHERYAAADKGWLDDVSARELAYARVRHQAEATRLELAALNQQNDLLKLERENARLYIVLLCVCSGFLALWGYRIKRSQLHFMRLARIDSLTGIASRPHFLDLAAQALDDARRRGQEVCIVLCDLDHFKAINDRFGHATGDYVLKQVVQSCGRHLRRGEIFGRFGGEEFGIVLPDCGPYQARERCEQLRVAIAEVAADPGSMVTAVSASFGIAASATSGYELRQLLAHADAALYLAKDAGRNRVMLYTPALVTPGHENSDPTTRPDGMPACRTG